MTVQEQFLEELVHCVGDQSVLRQGARLHNWLRDNSWLFPIQSAYFQQRKDAAGGELPLLAVAIPRDVEELRAVVSIAVRYGVPITVRGGGTTDFGQVLPLAGGIVIDTRRLNRIRNIGDDFVTVEAGVLYQDLDRTVRARGRDLTILPTVARQATVGGWVGGGHNGQGTPTYGTIWDGNVRQVRILTAEEDPQEIVLAGDDLDLVLHTFGTTGIITEVTLPLVKARDWAEAVAVFDHFADAVRFTLALAGEPGLALRAASASEPELAACFSPLARWVDWRQAAVLLIFDGDRVETLAALAVAHGGRLHRLDGSAPNGQLLLPHLVYGHMKLWVKKRAPEASFLWAFLPPGEILEGIEALKREFGDRIWLELYDMHSPWFRRLLGLPGEGPLPRVTMTLVEGRKSFVEAVMAFCDALGIAYRNVNTFVLEESGVFPHIDRILAFKRRVDPKGLLNPGKVSNSFFKVARTT